ncbi:dynamin family protein [Pleurocapsales cyanobacterium LEGE 10410]|nr:dynamin family protein [Pleurocapsales cyanobacterium LEGE 10410]
MSQYSSFLNSIRTLLGCLELDRASQLYQDAIALCSYLENSLYRIAVFAPFNHGKSTLLNALLGSKTLPIDLIPTTGAAIVVGYGEELQTIITLKNGEKIHEPGIKILQQYAILDGDRRMKAEVAEVRVLCHLPWLKQVELLDLPGTNDREAQNDLVKDRLLSADLIIQVLDARKLMTLEEREHLKHWLQNRGINTVIFVVNFLNLLTPEEQQEVRRRLCFVAESFRSTLPENISNIYCVDALPALRARLKGDFAAAQATGLASFESALHSIVDWQGDRSKLTRVFKLAEQLFDQATVKQQEIEQQIAAEQATNERQAVIKQKARQLIQQGFNRSVADFQGWLYLPNLLTNHQPSLAIALQQARFEQWLEQFQSLVFEHQQAVNKWVKQGSEFFLHDNPELLVISFPDPPIIQVPEYIPNAKSNDYTSADYNIPKPLNSVLQGRVGTVILGGASYVINKVAPPDNLSQTQPSKITAQTYADAAETYLTSFSDRANNLLSNYEQLAVKYLTFSTQTRATNTDYQLQLLTHLKNNFVAELERLKNS